MRIGGMCLLIWVLTGLVFIAAIQVCSLLALPAMLLACLALALTLATSSGSRNAPGIPLRGENSYWRGME